MNLPLRACLLLAGLALPAAAAERLEPLALFGQAHAYDSIARLGSHLYAADDGGRLEIFEVRADATGLRRSLVLAGASGGLAASPDGHLLAWSSTGVRMFELRDPLDPHLAGVFPAADVKDVLARPPHVYVAAGSSLIVLDWSVPARPREIGRLELVRPAMDLAWDGQHLLFRDEIGLRVVGVADPARPALMGLCALPPGEKWRVTADGGLAVTESRGYPYSDEKAIVDVSDPWTPVQVGELELGGWYDLRGRLLVSPRAVYELADPGAPALLAEIDLPAYEAGSLDGGEMALADGVGLAMVDLADPTSPEIFYRLDAGAKPLAVVPWADSVAVVYDSRLDFYHCSSPGRPELRGSLAIGALWSPVTVFHDGLLVALTDYQEIAIVEASDPGAPELLCRHSFDGYPQALALADSFLYAAGQATGPLNSGLWVLDLRDPRRPVETAFVGYEGYYGQIAVAPGALYAEAGSWQDGIFVFDRSDPAFPRLCGAIETGGDRSWQIASDGRYLYVSDREAEVDVYDLAEPLAPRFLATVTTSGAGEIAAAGGVLARGSPLALFGTSGLPVLEPLGAAPTSLSGLALGPGGVVYGVNGSGHAFDARSVCSYRPSPAPLALIGGFVPGTEPGAVRARAWTGNPGIGAIELTYDGIGTGVFLEPTGEGFFELPLDLAGAPAGRHLLGLRGEGSDLWRPNWPYLEVR